MGENLDSGQSLDVYSILQMPHDDRELKPLSTDLESASRQNKAVAFFNTDDDISSMENHDQSLTGIITDLTVSNASFLQTLTIVVRRPHSPPGLGKTPAKLARTSMMQ